MAKSYPGLDSAELWQESDNIIKKFLKTIYPSISNNSPAIPHPPSTHTQNRPIYELKFFLILIGMITRKGGLLTVKIYINLY